MTTDSVYWCGPLEIDPTTFEKINRFRKKKGVPFWCLNTWLSQPKFQCGFLPRICGLPAFKNSTQLYQTWPVLGQWGWRMNRKRHVRNHRFCKQCDYRALGLSFHWVWDHKSKLRRLLLKFPLQGPIWYVPKSDSLQISVVFCHWILRSKAILDFGPGPFVEQATSFLEKVELVILGAQMVDMICIHIYTHTY